MTSQDKLTELWKARGACIFDIFEGAFIYDLVKRKMKPGRAYQLSEKQIAFIDKIYARSTEDGGGALPLKKRKVKGT
jgi:hypothetical protein